MGGDGRGVIWLRLSETKQSSYSLLLCFAQFCIQIESTLLRTALVEEHVVVMRFASHNFATAGYPKPLRCCLARL